MSQSPLPRDDPLSTREMISLGATVDRINGIDWFRHPLWGCDACPCGECSMPPLIRNGPYFVQDGSCFGCQQGGDPCSGRGARFQELGKVLRPFLDYDYETVVREIVTREFPFPAPNDDWDPADWEEELAAEQRRMGEAFEALSAWDAARTKSYNAVRSKLVAWKELIETRLFNNETAYKKEAERHIDLGSLYEGRRRRLEPFSDTMKNRQTLASRQRLQQQLAALREEAASDDAKRQQEADRRAPPKFNF